MRAPLNSPVDPASESPIHPTMESPRSSPAGTTLPTTALTGVAAVPSEAGGPAAPRAWLTPARQRGHEFLDDPDLDPALATRSLRDVARANRLFGGTAAVLAALMPLFAQLPAQGARLLDVGTGLGDIPRAARRRAGARGVALRTIGLEISLPLAQAAREGAGVVTAADARRLPFADASVDVVTCSQVLHHFDADDARALLQECHRVARHAVIISDIRRSWLAAGLLWSVSFPLGFHPISRADGVQSVMRGFTASELGSIVRDAVGAAPAIVSRLGWRLTATWLRG